MKTERWEQLDGLRAFAIALVVASHTQAFKLTGQGGLAVAFFFVLSGYLLVLPWNKDGYLSRLFRLPFIVYIGQMSYVIYLVHFFMIPHVSFPSPTKTFCAVFAASLGLAAVWNEWIEKPLQRLASHQPERKK